MKVSTIMKPKVFIFDIFGVLCDSYNSKWEKENLINRPELKSVFDELSIEIDLGRKFESDYYKEAAKVLGVHSHEVQNQMESGFRVHKDLFKIISRLRKIYKVGTLSDSGARFVRPIFERFGFPLDTLFDFVFISSETGFLKPSVEAYNYCLQNLNVKPSECIFVDDSQRNVDGAASLGIHSFLFSDTRSFESWLITNGLLPSTLKSESK